MQLPSTQSSQCTRIQQFKRDGSRTLTLIFGWGIVAMTIDDGIDPTQKQNYLSDAEFVEVRNVLHADTVVGA